MTLYRAGAEPRKSGDEMRLRNRLGWLPVRRAGR